MNNRQLKKKYKKLYDFDFIEEKINEVFPTGVYKIKIAFYDVKAKNIRIILNYNDHGYYDIIDDFIIF